MSRRRSQPPPRVRPRWSRIGSAFLAASVTMVALLGATGLLPVQGSAASVPRLQLSGLQTRARPTAPPAEQRRTPPATPTSTPTPTPSAPSTATAHPVPAHSGSGRRVVFDMSAQRVWLVDRSGALRSTYSVSGSLTDNLRPGTYAVFSRSRWAIGVDDSGVMQYFVRFAHGRHAAIGFHSIPTHRGRPLQSRAELGTPQSHGCIRQAMPDAHRMWVFARTGTKVVVTA